MLAILILVPYILVPLLVTHLSKRFQLSEIGFTYVMTGLIIFCYPFVFLWINDYLNPPPPGSRCGIFQVSLFVGNIFYMLPVTLLVQFVVNKVLLNNKVN